MECQLVVIHIRNTYKELKRVEDIATNPKDFDIRNTYKELKLQIKKNLR